MSRKVVQRMQRYELLLGAESDLAVGSVGVGRGLQGERGKGF